MTFVEAWAMEITSYKIIQFLRGEVAQVPLMSTVFQQSFFHLPVFICLQMYKYF
jgi:hypothetical protein